jgi:hypothetical protein
LVLACLAATVNAGTVTTGNACANDPEQTYTLFLPDGYREERTWPVLLLLDPRGRSEYALEIFREGAETHQWVVVSLDGSTSDYGYEPNRRALAAVWPELGTRVAVDWDRLYAAGFSGTGSFITNLASKSEALRGIIVSGAPFAPETFEGEHRFAWYGAAGDTDYNHLSMHHTEELLATREQARRLEIFAGDHRWMPASLASRALDWMELQAMREKLRPLDEDLVKRLLAADLERAEELEHEGRLFESYRLLESTERSYQGLADLAGVVARRAALDDDKALRQARKEARSVTALERSLLAAMDTSNDRILGGQPPSLATMRRDLRINQLHKWATENGPRAAMAYRVFGAYIADLTFYLPRELRQAERHRDVATLLILADEIRPGDPIVSYNIACALAQSGRTKEALERLSLAVDHGFDNRNDLLSRDTDLDPLRSDPRFDEIVARLKSASSTAK